MKFLFVLLAAFTFSSPAFSQSNDHTNKLLRHVVIFKFNDSSSPEDVKKVAAVTADYSGADLNAVIDIAVEEKLRESMRKGSIQVLTTRDLLAAVKQHKPTTTEWFSSARNYALYSNESGLYDDILKYLKIRK